MSGCAIRGCFSAEARTGGVCDECWGARRGALLAIPSLWVLGHNVLPPGAHGLSDGADRAGTTREGLHAHSSHTAGSRSPVSDFAIETLHQTAMELCEWANVCLRVRELNPITKAGKRWGAIISDALSSLETVDEDLRYSSLGADYAGGLFAMRSRLLLLVGLDTLIHKLPAPCGNCNKVGLIRHNGKDVVVCTGCGGKWPETEYRKHVLVLARHYQFASIRSPKEGRQ